MNKNRVKIIDTENSISISIKSHKSPWYLCVFSLSAIAALTITVNVLYTFFTSYREQKLNYFLICSVLAIILTFHTRAILWMLIGYELIEIDTSHLVIRRKIKKYSVFKRSFNTKELNNFRIYQPEKKIDVYLYNTYTHMASLGLIDATLRFNDNKRYYEFGYLLNATDTEYIYNSVVAFCSNNNISIV